MPRKGAKSHTFNTGKRVNKGPHKHQAHSPIPESNVGIGNSNDGKNSAMIRSVTMTSPFTVTGASAYSITASELIDNAVDLFGTNTKTILTQQSIEFRVAKDTTAEPKESECPPHATPYLEEDLTDGKVATPKADIISSEKLFYLSPRASDASNEIESNHEQQEIVIDSPSNTLELHASPNPDARDSSALMNDAITTKLPRDDGYYSASTEGSFPKTAPPKISRMLRRTTLESMSAIQMRQPSH
jgi:hypothetical protein